ncbi:MAG: hypothetical protein RJA63_1912 [Pseudomonadota bacterium]|jgi:hypothetical protein
MCNLGPSQVDRRTAPEGGCPFMAGNAGSLESLTVEVGELESALKDGLQARRRNHTPGQLLTSNRQEGDLDNDRYGSRADIDERPFEGLLFGSGRSRASGACRRQMRAVGLPLDLSNRQCWPSDVMDRNNRGVGDAAVAIAVCSGRTRAGTAKRSLHTSNSACTIVGWGDHSWTVDGASGGTRPE